MDFKTEGKISDLELLNKKLIEHYPGKIFSNFPQISKENLKKKINLFEFIYKFISRWKNSFEKLHNCLNNLNNNFEELIKNFKNCFKNLQNVFNDEIKKDFEIFENFSNDFANGFEYEKNFFKNDLKYFFQFMKKEISNVSKIYEEFKITKEIKRYIKK